MAWGVVKNEKFPWEGEPHPDDLREREEKLNEMAAMFQGFYDKDPVKEKLLQRWMAITTPPREYGATWLGQPKERPLGNRITLGAIDLEGKTTQEAKDDFEEEIEWEEGRKNRHNDIFPHPMRHRRDDWWLFMPNRGFEQQ